MSKEELKINEYNPEGGSDSCGVGFVTRKDSPNPRINRSR